MRHLGMWIRELKNCDTLSSGFPFKFIGWLVLNDLQFLVNFDVAELLEISNHLE